MPTWKLASSDWVKEQGAQPHQMAAASFLMTEFIYKTLTYGEKTQLQLMSQ